MIKDLFKIVMMLLHGMVGMAILFLIFAAYVIFTFWSVSQWGLVMLWLFPIGIVICIVIYRAIK